MIPSPPLWLTWWDLLPLLSPKGDNTLWVSKPDWLMELKPSEPDHISDKVRALLNWSFSHSPFLSAWPLLCMVHGIGKTPWHRNWKTLDLSVTISSGFDGNSHSAGRITTKRKCSSGIWFPWLCLPTSFSLPFHLSYCSVGASFFISHPADADAPKGCRRVPPLHWWE